MRDWKGKQSPDREPAPSQLCWCIPAFKDYCGYNMNNNNEMQQAKKTEILHWKWAEGKNKNNKKSTAAITSRLWLEASFPYFTNEGILMGFTDQRLLVTISLKTMSSRVPLRKKRNLATLALLRANDNAVSPSAVSQKRLGSVAYGTCWSPSFSWLFPFLSTVSTEP